MCEHHAVLLLCSVPTLGILNPRQRQLLLLQNTSNLAQLRMVSVFQVMHHDMIFLVILRSCLVLS